MDLGERIQHQLNLLRKHIRQNRLLITSRSNSTGSEVDSSDKDEQKPLSHAEESAIEECLNDTEGSLSTVDLNIFDDVGDEVETHLHKVKKSREKRTSERLNMGFGHSGTDCDSSSVDENTFQQQKALRTSSLDENMLNNHKPTVMTRASPLTSMDQTISKIAQISLRRNSIKEHKERLRRLFSKSPTDSLVNVRRIVRRKRRNSPPIRKNDKTHIFSFFSAMADLVSTFPNNHVVTAKYMVNSILHEIVDNLKKRHNDKDPNGPPQDYTMNPTDFRLINYKLSRPPFVR